MADNFFKISKGATLAPQAAEPTGQNGDLYYNSLLNKFRRYENGNWKNMGGEGSGFKNILSEENSKFESGVSNWVTYNDSAAQPVDGTGGTASNLTIATTTVSGEILEGLASLKISKGAANAQGQGTSVGSLTIDREDRGKSFFVSLSVDTSHANYRYGDYQLWAYDITNGRLLSVYNNNGNGLVNQGKGRVEGIIYTEETTQQVRFILHCASTNATAHDVFIDSVVITPQANVVGPIITPWQDFPSVAAGTLITATTTAPTYGTTATNKAQWRRVGSNMEIRWDYRQTTAGTTGSGLYLFNLPPGYQIDTNKAKANTTTTLSGAFADSSVGKFQVVYTSITAGDVHVYDSTRLKCLASTNTVGGFVWGSAGYDFATNANMMYSLYASVPILGWDNSTVMSQNDAGLQTVRVIATTSVTAGTTAVPYKYTNVVEDNYNCYNPVTGQITIPATRSYRVSAQLGGSLGAVGINLYLNGVKLIEGQLSGSVTNYPLNATYRFNKGDVIEIRPSGNATADGDATANFLMLESIPDFNVFGVQGPVVVGAMTDWVPFTPTFSDSFGVVTQIECYWRRIGSDIHVRGTFQPGTVTTAIPTMSLPNGYKIDTTKIPLRTNGQAAILGQMVWNIDTTLTTLDAGNRGFGVLTQLTGTNDTILFSYSTDLNGNATGTLFAQEATSTRTSTNEPVTFYYSFPAIGVSSETRLYPTQRVTGNVFVSDTQNSGVAGLAYTSSVWNTARFNTLEGDTGFCSINSNQITLQPGTYNVKASLTINATAARAAATRMYNITTSSVHKSGQSFTAQGASGNEQNICQLKTRITITVPTVYEFQVFPTSNLVSGGVSLSQGQEVYNIVEIEKIY